MELVGNGFIEVTDDNYGLNVTDRWRIATTSPAWPDNFIHFHDQSAPTAIATAAGTLAGIYRTSNGTVDIHLLSGMSGFQTSAGDWASSLGVGAAGTQFQLVDMDGDGKPDLVGMYPSAGHVDVHVVTASSGYRTSGGDWASSLGVGAAGTQFQLVDMDGDGKPDLVGMYPSAGHVDVHVVKASSGYQTSGGDWASSLGSGPGDAQWQLADVDGDRRPDLVGMFPSGTTGHVDIHVVSAASGYQRGAGDWSSGFLSPQTTATFRIT